MNNFMSWKVLKFATTLSYFIMKSLANAFIKAFNAPKQNKQTYQL